MADITLIAGPATLTLDTTGGGLRTLDVDGWQVLDGYPAETKPHGKRGRILAPWPNRIYRGRYRWDGDDFELPINDEEHESAIHGLVDSVTWTVEEHSAAEATLAVDVEPVEGYPFPLRVAVDYRITDDDLSVRLSARNTGDRDAPFGAGMHPYLSCGANADGTTVELPVTQRLPLDHNGAPAGALEPFDGDLGRVADRVYDAALTGLERSDDGWAHARLSGPAGGLTMSTDPAWPWLMLFTSDTLPGEERRRSVAVEPMTCPPGAFATGTDVIRLVPGDNWTGTWRLAWTPA